MNELILTRIDFLQNELNHLKKMILDKSTDEKKPKTKLKGLWKNVSISDEEIQESKNS